MRFIEETPLYLACDDVDDDFVDKFVDASVVSILAFNLLYICCMSER